MAKRVKHQTEQFTLPFMSELSESDRIAAIDRLCYDSHKNSVLHGFYEGRDFNLGEKLFLVVTELAEGFEGDRRGIAQKPDEHCPDFTNFEIEVADACIRIFDLAEYKKLRLGQAILAKMYYNSTRPYKHNKNY